MLSWVFFDVGNVILNDDPAQTRAFVLLHQAMVERGSPLSFSDLLAERRKLFEEQGPEPTRPYFQTLGKRVLGAEYLQVLASMAADLFPRWGEVSPLLPGIREVIRGLADNYNLGIAANQPHQVVEVLKGHGLWDCFKVRAISAELGMQKPDPCFFRWALEQAGCTSAEAVMVGDRLDNDILPAKSLGMKTIQVILNPADKGYAPADELEKAYMEERLRWYQHANRIRPEADIPSGVANSGTADATVYKVEELARAVAIVAATTA